MARRAVCSAEKVARVTGVDEAEIRPIATNAAPATEGAIVTIRPAPTVVVVETMGARGACVGSHSAGLSEATETRVGAEFGVADPHRALGSLFRCGAFTRAGRIAAAATGAVTVAVAVAPLDAT